MARRKSKTTKLLIAGAIAYLAWPTIRNTFMGDGMTDGSLTTGGSTVAPRQLTNFSQYNNTNTVAGNRLRNFQRGRRMPQRSRITNYIG